MAGELKHASVGTALSQAEYEDVSGHTVDSYAEGDILYVNGSGQIVRLAKGTATQVLLSGTAPNWGPGAWTDYACTWGADAGVQPALGDGTLTARYLLLGNLCLYEVRLVFGSTSTFGSGGAVYLITIPPVTARLKTDIGQVTLVKNVGPYGQCWAKHNASAGWLQYQSLSGVNYVYTTAPWTWASGDYIEISGVFEVA